MTANDLNEQNEFKSTNALTEASEEDEGDFVVPRMGVDVMDLKADLDTELLSDGRHQIEKEINTVKGQLTQPMYDLLVSDSLTKENLLQVSDKVNPSTVENKFVLLKRRYYVHDNLLHDVKRRDLVVYEPNKLFDLIISTHILNNHASPKVVYNILSSYYANVTQYFCKLATSYCSKCIKEGSSKQHKKFKHENIHANLVPLGRCHIEIFAPFDPETEGSPLKIENKYPYVLYCRDYYSRYVWLEPLKSVQLSTLLPTMAKLFFTMVRMPIFIDTCTLDKQDMFDVCEHIARKYKIKIGLGMNSSTSFQKSGIKRLKTLLLQNKKACLKDWNMCLKLAVHRINQTYCDRVRGVPSDMLCASIPNLNRKFRTLQRRIIATLMGHHVVQFEETGGMIYLEDQNNPNLLSFEDFDDGEEQDEEDDEEEEEEEEKEDDANSDSPVESIHPLKKRNQEGQDDIATKKKHKSNS